MLGTRDSAALNLRRKRAGPATLEGESYSNLNLGTGSIPVFHLGKVEQAVIIADDNLKVTSLDAHATAEVDVERIGDTALVQGDNFLLIRAVHFSVKVVQSVFSGRLDKGAISGGSLIGSLAAERNLENRAAINEEIDIPAQLECIIQVDGDIERKFPVGFPFVLKGTINGLTVVPPVNKCVEIHSGGNAKAGNQIEVVLAAQVKTIEVCLVRISVCVFCYFS